MDYLLNNFYYSLNDIKNNDFSFSELILFYIINELIFKHIKEILKESYDIEWNLILSDFNLKFYESKFEKLIIYCNMERFEYYRVKNHCQKYKEEIGKLLKKLFLNSNIIETETIYMTRYLLNNNKIFEENDEINDVIKKNLKKECKLKFGNFDKFDTNFFLCYYKIGG